MKRNDDQVSANPEPEQSDPEHRAILKELVLSILPIVKVDGSHANEVFPTISIFEAGKKAEAALEHWKNTQVVAALDNIKLPAKTVQSPGNVYSGQSTNPRITEGLCRDFITLNCYADVFVARLVGL